MDVNASIGPYVVADAVWMVSPIPKVASNVVRPPRAALASQLPSRIGPAVDVKVWLKVVQFMSCA